MPPPPPPSGTDGGGGGKGRRPQTGSGRGGFWSGRLKPVGSSERAEARGGQGAEAGGERRAFLSNELPIGDAAAASLASASAANRAPSLRFPPSSRTSSGKRSPERKTICALTGRGGDVKRAAVRSLPVVKSDACRLPLELKTWARQEIQSCR